jgi:hypothetical protein
MKIFCLWVENGDYDRWWDLLGLYSTKELAEHALAEIVLKGESWSKFKITEEKIDQKYGEAMSTK